MAAIVAELHVFQQHNFTTELVQQFALLRRLEMDERTVDIGVLKVDTTDFAQQVGAVIAAPLMGTLAVLQCCA
eukprot:3456008-Amphidinium_carterae.1